MNVAVVINPKSGNQKDRKDLANRFEQLFQQSFPEGSLEIAETTHAGHATELAKLYSTKKFDACIAAGGDGTMNEVARGLIGSGTALGLVPLGSGNGLARHLKISLNPETAFRQAILGKASPMDCGLANGRPFFLAAGIGFEGEVSHRFATKKTRGFGQYILSSTECFFRYSPITVEGNLDSVPFRSTVFTMTMANGSQYGNGAFISPGSEIDDGILQLVRVSPFPLLASAGLFFGLMKGTINASPYHTQTGFKKLELHSEQPLPGHIDGEPVDFGTHLRVEIVPSALLIRKPDFQS